MGLPFTIAGGPRQRIDSRVRVAWDSRPYFTLSDSSPPFLYPPSTRRATMEVFDPASTREWCVSSVSHPLKTVLRELNRDTLWKNSVYPLSCKRLFVDAVTEVRLAFE
jgi:hypothetical protein